MTSDQIYVSATAVPQGVFWFKIEIRNVVKLLMFLDSSQQPQSIKFCY